MRAPFDQDAYDKALYGGLEIRLARYEAGLVELELLAADVDDGELDRCVAGVQLWVVRARARAAQLSVRRLKAVR